VHAHGGHRTWLLPAVAFSSGLCACHCRMSADAMAHLLPSYALVLSWLRRAAAPRAGPDHYLGGRRRINVALFLPSNLATVKVLAVFPASSHAYPCRDVIAPLASRHALTPRGGLRLALFCCRRHSHLDEPSHPGSSRPLPPSYTMSLSSSIYRGLGRVWPGQA